MIGKAGLAMLALLAMGQSSPNVPEGPITLSFEQDANMRGGTMRFRIAPGGKFTFDAVSPDIVDPKAPPQRVNLRRDGGDTVYRRMAALVAPLRRWKDAVPCNRPKRDPAAPILWGTDDVTLTIRWEADGMMIKVPVTCGGFGPADNDIELARAALDQMRAWIQPESGLTEDGPGNTTANATEYDVTD